MYRKASRQTGGSQLHGYALKASDAAILAEVERSAAETLFARQLLALSRNGKCNVAEGLSDYDLALLVVKLVEGCFTTRKRLLTAAKLLSVRLVLQRLNLSVSTAERSAVEADLAKMIARWKHYRALD